MTWMRQVVHVVGKDLRQWRRMYALYAAVVAIAVIHALGGLEMDVLDVAAGFVVLMAMILAAVLVQGDSPTRADAFWASRPIQPSAVTGAKVVQAVLIVLLAVVGQVIALGNIGIAAADMGTILIAAMGVFGLWLASALVAAAMTKDLQGAIVAFLATAVAFGFILALTESVPTVLVQWRVPLGVLSAALAVGMMAWFYRVRHRRPWMTALCCAAMLGPVTMYLPSTGSGPSTVKPEPAADGLSLRVQRGDSLPLDRAEVPFVISLVGSTPQQRATLSEASAVFTLADGSTLKVKQQLWIQLTPGDGLGAFANLHWITPPSAKRDDWVVKLRLSDDDRARLRTGVRSMEVEGPLRISEPRVVTDLPYRAGAQRHDSGRFVRIDSVFSRGGLGRIYMSGPESVARSRSNNPYDVNAPYFALVNEQRGEGIMLTAAGSTSTNNWLVMPGVSIVSETFTLGMPGSRVSNAIVTNSSIVAFEERNSPLPAALGVPAALSGPVTLAEGWDQGAKLLLLDWRQTKLVTVHGVLNFTH